MNIFLILLMSLFMAGYYMFFAPNTRVVEQETDHAIVVSDLRSIAECALAVHNAKITGNTFDDINSRPGPPSCPSGSADRHRG